MTNGRRASGQVGQATVELALVLPLLLALTVVVIHVGLLVRAQVLVVHATREAARAAAVDPGSDAARHAAESVRGLDPDRLSVTTRRDGRRVTAFVSYQAATNVRFLGRKLPGILLKEQVTAHVED
jgi:Flp pilus assembly protein TadG